MQAIILILVFLIGFLILSRLAPSFTLLERGGFAFPVGLSLVTFLMLMADWLGAPLSRPVVWTILFILLLASLALLLPVRRAFVQAFTRRIDFSFINALWIVAFLTVAYLEYANLMKTVYFPAYDRDSLAGFDTIGFVAAREHTFHSLSIFAGDYMPSIHGPGSYISYMPMLQLSYALVYLFDAPTSKLIPAILWLSFLFGLYGVSRRFFRTSSGEPHGGDTAAMLVVLFTMFATEMVSFSSLSGTNVPQAVAAAPGLAYVILWYRGYRLGRSTSISSSLEPLFMGCALLSVSCWLRLEGFIFTLIAFCVVLVGVLLGPAKSAHPIVALSRRARILTPILTICTLLPIIVFQIYSSSLGLTSEGTVITHPYWDAAKARTVLDYALMLLRSTGYYGPSFLLLAAAFLLSLPLLVKGRGVMTYLALFSAFAMYFVMLYQIDYKWDTIENVLSYSAKRFLFCFVPLALVCALCQGNLARLADWIERLCSFRKQ